MKFWTGLKPPRSIYPERIACRGTHLHVCVSIAAVVCLVEFVIEDVAATVDFKGTAVIQDGSAKLVAFFVFGHFIRLS